MAEAEDAKSGSDTEEEDEGEGGLLANADELNKEIAPPSRNRQMNAGNLDAKIVKALKKQEEKREKKVTRKKEVRQLRFLLFWALEFTYFVFQHDNRRNNFQLSFCFS